ncbi:hypothetical protein ABZ848_08010 [Streptomyces sp. NPDC047081]|uniref:hypothetical protein n=1 Tax=Streptomyces sp. NPDC047081 TaxID=3154706 RepID=UPI0033ECCCE2
MTSTDLYPRVLRALDGTRAVLWPRELLLEGGGVRRRIPLKAIARVKVQGDRSRRLTIVLRTAGHEPVTYGLDCRESRYVQEFAEAVRRVLPEKVSGGPFDGPRLVTEEPLERRLSPRARRVRWALGIGYALGPLALWAGGAGAVLVLVWLLFPWWLFALRWVFGSGADPLREIWGLRTRGIVTEGRLERSIKRYAVEGPVVDYVYSYVDADGMRCERTGPQGGRRTVEIRYDPARSGVAKVGRGTAGWLVAQGVLFLLQLALALWGPVLLVVLLVKGLVR